MTWIPLLLSDPSPNLRLLVLKELLYRPDDDDEIQELIEIREGDPIVRYLLKRQLPDGSWNSVDLNSAKGSTGTLQATSQALVRLGYLGFDINHDFVKKAINYLYSRQENDGSWAIPKSITRNGEEIANYDMIPLQTATPLEGIAACGLATDKRAEKAYDWLNKQRRSLHLRVAGR